MVMTINTGKTQFPVSREPGIVKPTQAAAAVAFLQNPSKQTKAAPSQAEIRMRAYEIWLSQGQEQGQDQKHWFQAEQQLRHN
jgi:hypothetical protein